MAVVDTSFLIALQNRDDRFHEAAMNTPLMGDRFLIPREVWVEYVDVLMRLIPLRQVSQVVESTLAGPFEIREVFEPDGLPGLVMRAEQSRGRRSRSGSKRLSIFDLVVCAAAERYREAILTFDEGIIAAVRGQLFPGARIA